MALEAYWWAVDQMQSSEVPFQKSEKFSPTGGEVIGAWQESQWYPLIWDVKSHAQLC